MKEVNIRLGGVPEHFNLPIHLAVEGKQFESRGVKIQWTTFNGGTGEMTQALRNGDIDACILLTEGIITDIINGNPSKIISEYVTTPLTWGVHTSVNNPLENYQKIYDKQYAISRFGSGSHLMAIVDANSNGYTLKKEQFEIVENLQEALKSLKNLETDVFYWEKYTTKPYVTNGLLKRIGEYKTPWPCFVIAASDDIIKREPANLTRMLRTIHDQCDRFMQAEDAPLLVSKRYDQQLKDAERWYHNTAWAMHGWVSDKMIKSVIYHLKAADIVKNDAVIPELIWKR